MSHKCKELPESKRIYMGWANDFVFQICSICKMIKYTACEKALYLHGFENYDYHQGHRDCIYYHMKESSCKEEILKSVLL
jgi:hypothetical protein